MITKQSTLNMSREEWLKERVKGIGGSDAGTVMGVNAYSSPYALWCEKTGKSVPEDISDKEAVRLGTDLEQYVAERWCEKTGKKVRRDNAIIYNDEFPWAFANIDRSVVGEKAGLECKTTSSWEVLQKCREGNYPETWYCQMTHYMAVTGAEKWYLGVLVFGHGFYEFELQRNDAEIKALMDAERDFWERVVNTIPPEIDGTKCTQDALRTIFKDSIPGSKVDLTPMSYDLLCIEKLKAQIEDLENQLTEHESKIMNYMGSSEKGSYDKYTVSWKVQSRSTFDRKAFEAANGPIANVWFKQSESRPFKVSIKKEK